MRRLFASVVLLLFCLCSYARSEDLMPSYFPLIDGDSYTYRGFSNGKEYISTIKTKIHYLPNGTKIYYFLEDADGKDDHAIIGANAFGLGAYFYEKNNLYTIKAFWKSDLRKIDYSQRQVLLGCPGRIGDQNELIVGESNPVITVMLSKFEDVFVPAGKFKNCAMIRVSERWECGKVYVSYVWLAKNIGVVKWHRSTGRIEELLRYIPAK